MSHETLQHAPVATASQVPASKAATPAGEHLSRLFSVTLGQGRLHPLYLPLLSYRSAGNAVAA